METRDKSLLIIILFRTVIDTYVYVYCTMYECTYNLWVITRHQTGTYVKNMGFYVQLINKRPPLSANLLIFHNIPKPT